jgi:hypothetical protein
MQAGPRRQFIAGLAGAAAAMPCAAPAQQEALPVIGYIAGSPDFQTVQRAEFFRGLREVGRYAVGRTVAIEYRWVESSNEQLSTVLSDLIRQRMTIRLRCAVKSEALAEGQPEKLHRNDSRPVKGLTTGCGGPQSVRWQFDSFIR